MTTGIGIGCGDDCVTVVVEVVTLNLSSDETNSSGVRGTSANTIVGLNPLTCEPEETGCMAESPVSDDVNAATGMASDLNS